METLNRAPQVLKLVGVAALYFAVGRLGLLLATLHPDLSPVWPAAGLAVAALLLLGRGLWPAVLVGDSLVTLTTGGSLGVSLGIAAGNTLEAVVAAWLVERFARGTAAFERPPDIFRFALLAGLLATTIGATLGAGSLVLGGGADASQFARIWLTWWLGDAAGVLVMAPALICWIVGEPFTCGRAQLIEAIGFLATLAAVGFLAFGFVGISLRFLCLPLLIWTAFRFGRRGTAVVIPMLSAFAVWGALRTIARPPPGDDDLTLLGLQVFMGVVALTGLALAAVVDELRRALDALEWQTRELARSNAELDDFAHVVSHDLKAPLRGISSLVGWITDDCKDLLPEASTEHLRLLDGRTRRMGRLIDGVLAYSRVARARTTRERIDAGDVVGEVIDSLGPMRAAVRVEGRLPAVRYDRTQLAQVFQNLIGNAAQHMGREDGAIVVSCREWPEVFEFSVSDDGIGIEEQHADRVFRMFHALRPERETIGVGLTIVRKIVEMHGGAIRIGPTPGGGATFSFSVPKQARDRSRGLA